MPTAEAPRGHQGAGCGLAGVNARPGARNTGSGMGFGAFYLYFCDDTDVVLPENNARPTAEAPRGHQGAGDYSRACLQRLPGERHPCLWELAKFTSTAHAWRPTTNPPSQIHRAPQNHRGPCGAPASRLGSRSRSRPWLGYAPSYQMKMYFVINMSRYK